MQLRHSVHIAERVETKMTTSKTYLELIQLPTFLERFRYLQIGGQVGIATFGFNRYLNQALYTSKEWKDFRRAMIERDLACDLADSEREIGHGLTLHHINPITEKDILERSSNVFDPNNVICCSSVTHRAIHYGSEELLLLPRPERKVNDTIPWR